MVLKGVVQLLPLFLLMLLGIVLGKKGLVTADFRRQLTDFCFLILFPASVVTSFEGMELSGDTLINSGKLVLAGGDMGHAALSGRSGGHPVDEAGLSRGQRGGVLHGL